MDVLVVAPARTLTFVEQDCAILARSYGVTVLSREELGQALERKRAERGRR